MWQGDNTEPFGGYKSEGYYEGRSSLNAEAIKYLEDFTSGSYIYFNTERNVAASASSTNVSQCKVELSPQREPENKG